MVHPSLDAVIATGRKRAENPKGGREPASAKHVPATVNALEPLEVIWVDRAAGLDLQATQMSANRRGVTTQMGA